MQFGLPIGPSNSGDGEALACRGWYIYVSLPVLPHWPLSSTRPFTRDPPFLVGNSSRPLTMSGMSSEVIAPTDGRYGFVTFIFGFVTVHFTTDMPALGLLRCALVYPSGCNSQHGRL